MTIIVIFGHSDIILKKLFKTNEIFFLSCFLVLVIVLLKRNKLDGEEREARIRSRITRI